MKISKATIDVLKNYSTINPSIRIHAGNEIRTVTSVGKSILSMSTVEEEFPFDFAIYELNKFLGVISLFEDPDFEFDVNSVRINGDRHSVLYHYADWDTINQHLDPSKDLYDFEPNLPDDSSFEFDLQWADFNKITRGAAILKRTCIRVRVESGKVYLDAFDPENAGGDVYSVQVDDNTDFEDSTYLYKIEKMKFLEGEYRVKISNKMPFALFESDTRETRYVIGEHTDA